MSSTKPGSGIRNTRNSSGNQYTRSAGVPPTTKTAPRHSGSKAVTSRIGKLCERPTTYITKPTAMRPNPSTFCVRLTLPSAGGWIRVISQTMIPSTMGPCA